ncbi:hypothetical protein E0L36_04510 [Streptomyces sp. AJS327]|uniref:hypothetical protein n=1 Tax=Streptomyces sp. AJS327 TaxID=2545265 RepID=UPI0015DEB904|nr:hypothetical protein [Streptomyces sp. AJS327]MBA0050185.1 hypothetical protein [Streptomyces sp. AJS327]
MTAFRTVPTPWGRLQLFGCVPCLRQLIDLERARTRELTAPFRTPIGAGLLPASRTSDADEPSPQPQPQPQLRASDGALERAAAEPRVSHHVPSAPLWCPGRCRGPGL